MAMLSECVVVQRVDVEEEKVIEVDSARSFCKEPNIR